MKKFTPLVLLCGLLMTAEGLNAGVAYQRDKTQQYITPPADLCSPWFSAIKGGVWWVEDFEVAPTVDAEFDTGWGITVVPIGYRMSDLLSISFSAGYYNADLEAFSSGGLALPASGDITMVPLMANAVLHFPVADRLSVYVGAGLGAVYHEVDVTNFLGLSGSQDDWDFGVQGIAGLSFEIVRCVNITAGYRYNHVFADSDDIRGHSVEAGVVIHW